MNTTTSNSAIVIGSRRKVNIFSRLSAPLARICLGACLAAAMAVGRPVMAGDAPPNGNMLPAVSAEKVRILTQSEPKTYVSTVSGSETVNILPRVSGTLWKASFKEGALVNSGDVLFEIEDTIYKANVLVAEALIKQAQADLDLAKKDHERNQELHKSKAIATQSFDQTYATQLLKEAKLEEAKANLILARHDLNYCRIESPISGRIGENEHSEGNYITPSIGVMATVVQYQPCKVQFSISESDFFRYFNSHEELGSVELSILRANGKVYEGGIAMAFVDNLVDQRTDTITITLECENPRDQLLPGGFVQVLLSEKYQEPVSAISLSAIMTDGKNHYVYVLTEDNVVERRAVVIGDVVNRYQAIRSGLSQGERVLTGGLNKVTPGAKVNPILIEANS